MTWMLHIVLFCTKIACGVDASVPFNTHEECRTAARSIIIADAKFKSEDETYSETGAVSCTPTSPRSITYPAPGVIWSCPNGASTCPVIGN
jgi:hypothetical protein